MKVGTTCKQIAIDIRKIGKKSTGSETYFYYLVKELAKLAESKKHRFLLLTDDRVARVKKILGSLPKNFEIFRVTPTSKALWTFYSLPRFLKKNPVDIFHTEFILPFYLSHQTKMVTVVHDISFKINPRWITGKDSFILNRLIPLSLRRADAVVAVSQFTKDEIVREYRCPEDKITVTYPAVDTRYFCSISQEEAQREVAKILGARFPFLLHISSLQPRKNVPMIIQSFGKIKKAAAKNLKLVIVGSRNGYNFDQKIDEEIQRQVLAGNIKLGDVIVTGYRPMSQLPYFYQAAEAFVFPSAYEGFGIPLIESMACGVPVVISDIPVFREVAGNAAVYVDIGKKNKAEKLAGAVKKLLVSKKLRAEKIRLGRERIKSFNWSQLAKKTLGIYDRLV